MNRYAQWLSFQTYRKRFIYIIWNWYGRKMKTQAAKSGEVRLDEGFKSLGYKSGIFDAARFGVFLETLPRAEPIPFRVGDVADGYYFTTAIDEGKINKANIFYRLSSPQLEPLDALLASIREELTSCLGCRWRVVNSRYWSTIAVPTAYGANNWHVDGFPNDILKLMIYPHETGGKWGTTELVLPTKENFSVSGPPGTWLLFKNSELLHRGVPPEQGGRKIVEVTIVPAKRYGLTGRFAGHNAQFPKYPWMAHS